jgi:hypothetical protein
VAALLIRDLQCLLGGLYGIEVRADVRDYLVTDAGTLGRLEQAGARESEEKLLIAEGDGELALALYLDAALLARLEALDPRERLCGQNLDDFWLAVEGVSHFNYVAWNAACDKAVTLLELEMQAEIDKYIGARLLLGRQQPGDVGARLHARLFDSPEFDVALDAAELCRYQDANHLAGRYCRSLAERFPGDWPGETLLRELRTFFRWPQQAKVSHIRSAVLS